MHVYMGCDLLAHMECGQFVDEDHTVLKGLIGDQFVKSFLCCARTSLTSMPFLRVPSFAKGRVVEEIECIFL